LYELQSETLSFIIRYSEFTACNDKVLWALGIQRTDLVSDDNGGQQGLLENCLPGVLPGTRFEVDNILFQIAFVDGETGLVRCSVVELDNEDSVQLNLQVGDEVVFEAHVVQRGVENRY